MTDYYTPVALFCYKRIDKLKQVVACLKNNFGASQTLLYIFCDGPKSSHEADDVNSVRDYANSITGFKEVIVESSSLNKGLANSIIDGVSKTIDKHGKVIVLEDDLITSPYFLEYMNDALELYKDSSSVGSIHGYLYDIKEPLPETFFTLGADCWGWATWKRAWKHFNPSSHQLLKILSERNLLDQFNRHYPNDNLSSMLQNQADNKIDSWAIRWIASCFLNNLYVLYPHKTLVRNIGLDGDGTHGDQYQDTVKLHNRKITVHKQDILELNETTRKFHEFFSHKSESPKKSFLKRISTLIKSMLTFVKSG